MRLSVDKTSAVPPFEQLRSQVIELVHSGEVTAGAKLPTVRGLADELGIAPGTVAKAYRQLEIDEVIETRGRAGSFIAASGDAIERQAQLAARQFADRLRELRVSPAEGIRLATAALAE